MKEIFSHIRNYLRWYTLVALFIASIILWSIVIHENRQGILTFAVLNIGQGDALFIESPTGTQVVVDGGPGKSLMREISSVMPWYDRNIDMLVVTNPDKDHYEGFIPLLDKYKVDRVLESGTQSSTDTYAYLENKIKSKKITEIIGRRGQVIDIGGGAYLQILFPDRSVASTSSNVGSLVMRLVYGNTSVILQGDSTGAIEHYLTGLDGDKLKSTILKVGHHGSRTSTTEEYVKSVSPLWAVISSGVDNSYSHPHKETLDTLEKLKILTLDTCNNGRIIFYSDGNIFTLKNKQPKPAIVGCSK